jgi:lipopolysaccharide export system protein LptA
MKKVLKSALILPMALAGSMLFAHEAQRQQPPAGAQTQQDAQQQQTTTGKIAKSDDGKYVLVDMSGTTFQLDDQDNAKKFDGKVVKVSGTVDTSSNTIHVTEIKPAA